MLQDTEKTIICPNCGFPATHNYCAQCGQETHLHKETSWSLITHFIGHYFHYDSKFWKTLRVLIFKPGQLTLAYWDKQRARYIPPISLYIFISAIYFLCYFIAFSNTEKKVLNLIDKQNKTVQKFEPSTGNDSSKTRNKHSITFNFPTKNKTNFNNNLEKVLKDPKMVFEIIEPMNHNMPKVYFFMIPIMAVILKLLFLKRTELYFVDHIVFSVHFHSFYFLIQLFLVVLQFFPANYLYVSVIVSIFGFAAMIIQAVYYISAMKGVYKITTTRAIVYSCTIGIAYLVVYLSALSIYFFYILSSM